MVIQLSKGIILRRTRRWFSTRWLVEIHEGTAETSSPDAMRWRFLTELLSADDMMVRLIAMHFPQSDIGLFVEALNNPGKTPFRKVSGARYEPSPLQRPPGKLSQEPKGLFHPEAKAG